MSKHTLKIIIESSDRSNVGMIAWDLRKRILDSVKELPEQNVSLTRENPDTLQFFETIVIDLAGASIAHLVFETIKIYFFSHRPAGTSIVFDTDDPHLKEQLQALIDKPTEKDRDDSAKK